MKFLSTILLLLSFTSLTIAQNKLQPEESQFDELFTDWTDDTKPGIALCIYNDGEKYINKGWGLANLEHQIPITENSVFLFPDFTEQLIAFSILLLEEEKVLSLNDPIGKYLDFVPSDFSKITLFQLLNHNGGLQSIEMLSEVSGFKHGDPLTESNFIDLVSKECAWQQSEVGKYNYVKAGMRMLQMIIEKSTNMSFDDFADERIFTPMGMEYSFIASPDRVIPNNVQSYIRNSDQFLLNDENQNFIQCDQTYMTTEDICKWGDNFWRPKVGSKQLWKKMDELVLDEGNKVEKKNRAQFIGQHRFWDYQGLDKYFAIGMTNGYSAKIIRYPKYDLTVAILGNFGDYNGWLATVASEYFLSPFFKPAETKVAKKYKKVASSDLEKYTGDFWDYNFESGVTIYLKEGTLIYKDELFGWEMPIMPIGDDQFFMDRRSGYTVLFDQKSGDMTLDIGSGTKFEFGKVYKPKLKSVHLTGYEGNYKNNELSSEFRIQKGGDELTLVHKRREPIVFTLLEEDTYVSENGYFTRLNFIRDKSGKISGFTLANRFIKTLLFEKVDVT